MDKYIRQYLTKLVPSLITATTSQPVPLGYNEAALRKLLFEPLEGFIVGPEHAEATDKFQHLKKNDVPTYLCLKYFKFGDHIYECHECRGVGGWLVS